MPNHQTLLNLGETELVSDVIRLPSLRLLGQRMIFCSDVTGFAVEMQCWNSFRVFSELYVEIVGIVIGFGAPCGFEIADTEDGEVGGC